MGRNEFLKSLNMNASLPLPSVVKIPPSLRTKPFSFPITEMEMWSAGIITWSLSGLVLPVILNLVRPVLEGIIKLSLSYQKTEGSLLERM